MDSEEEEEEEEKASAQHDAISSWFEKKRGRPRGSRTRHPNKVAPANAEEEGAREAPPRRSARASSAPSVYTDAGGSDCFTRFSPPPPPFASISAEPPPLQETASRWRRRGWCRERGRERGRGHLGR